MNTISQNSRDTKYTLTVYTDETKTTVRDLSLDSSLSLLVKKPDETVVAVAVTFVTDGTDGQIYALLPATLVNLVGKYQTQVKINSTAWDGNTSSDYFLVEEALVPTI